MSNRAIIATESAPAAIGPYSQAVKVGNTVWISGQIPLDPETMTCVEGGIEQQATRVFENLAAIAGAAGSPGSAPATIPTSKHAPCFMAAASTKRWARIRRRRLILPDR